MNKSPDIPVLEFEDKDTFQGKNHLDLYRRTRNTNYFCSMNKTVIIYGSPVQIFFLNMQTGLKLEMSVVEVNCVDGCFDKDFFALSIKKESMIQILHYPSLEVNYVLRDSKEADYIDLKFGGGDSIFALKKGEFFHILGWNWSNLEKIIDITLKNDFYVFIRPNVFSRNKLMVVRKKNKAQVIYIYTIGKWRGVQITTKTEVCFPLDDSRNSGNFPDIVDGCFDENETVFLIDENGAVYMGDSKTGVLKDMPGTTVRSGSIRRAPRSPVTRLPHLPLLRSSGNVLLVLTGTNTVKFFEREGNTQTWIPVVSAPSKSKITKVISNNFGSSFYCWTPSLGIIEINKKRPTTESPVSFNGGGIKSFAIIKPLEECFATVGELNFLIVWKMETGARVSFLQLNHEMKKVYSHPSLPFLFLTRKRMGSVYVVNASHPSELVLSLRIKVTEEVISEIQFLSYSNWFMASCFNSGSLYLFAADYVEDYKLRKYLFLGKAILSVCRRTYSEGKEEMVFLMKGGGVRGGKVLETYALPHLQWRNTYFLDTMLVDIVTFPSSPCSIVGVPWIETDVVFINFEDGLTAQHTKAPVDMAPYRIYIDSGNVIFYGVDGFVTCYNQNSKGACTLFTRYKAHSVTNGGCTFVLPTSDMQYILTLGLRGTLKCVRVECSGERSHHCSSPTPIWRPYFVPALEVKALGPSFSQSILLQAKEDQNLSSMKIVDLIGNKMNNLRIVVSGIIEKMKHIEDLEKMLSDFILGFDQENIDSYKIKKIKSTKKELKQKKIKLDSIRKFIIENAYNKMDHKKQQVFSLGIRVTTNSFLTKEVPERLEKEREQLSRELCSSLNSYYGCSPKLWPKRIHISSFDVRTLDDFSPGFPGRSMTDSFKEGTEKEAPREKSNFPLFEDSPDLLDSYEGVVQNLVQKPKNPAVVNQESSVTLYLDKFLFQLQFYLQHFNKAQQECSRSFRKELGQREVERLELLRDQSLIRVMTQLHVLETLLCLMKHDSSLILAFQKTPSELELSKQKEVPGLSPEQYKQFEGELLSLLKSDQKKKVGAEEKSLASYPPHQSCLFPSDHPNQCIICDMEAMKNYGSNSFKFVRPDPFSLEQVEACTPAAAPLQMAIGKITRVRLYKFYNVHLKLLATKKESVLRVLREHNEEYQRLREELQYTCRVPEEELPDIPENFTWTRLEQHSRIFQVTDGMVQEVSGLPPDPEGATLDSHLEEETDDFKKLALEDMMDGVLEKRWEDDLKADISKPSKASGEEFSEYLEKIETQRKEREKYKNILYDKIEEINKKISGDVDSLDLMVLELYRLGYTVSMSAKQETLKIARNRLKIAQQQKMQNCSEKMLLKILKLGNLNKWYNSLVKSMMGLTEERRAFLDKCTAYDKSLLDHFMNNFYKSNLISSATRKANMAVYSARPSFPAWDTLPSTHCFQLAFALQKNNQWRRKFLPPQLLKFICDLRDLENKTSKPDLLEYDQWSLLLRLRRQKVFAEICKTGANIELQQYEKTFWRVVQISILVYKQYITLVKVCNILLKNLESFYNKTEIQVVLPSLFVESGFSTEDSTSLTSFPYINSLIVLNKGAVKKINNEIQKYSKIKYKNLKVYYKTKTMTDELEWKWALWFHRALNNQVLLRDIYKTRMIPSLKQYLKLYLKREDKVKKTTRPLKVDEVGENAAKIEKMTNYYTKKKDLILSKVNQIQRKKNNFEKKIDKIKEQLEGEKKKLMLESLNQSLFVDQENKRKERAQMILKKTELVREIQRTQDEIEPLQLQLKLLRLRTYPSIPAPTPR